MLRDSAAAPHTLNTATLVAFNHYSSYRYTLSSNKQATDLIRYSDFRSKSPVIITILHSNYHKRFFKDLAYGYGNLAASRTACNTSVDTVAHYATLFLMIVSFRHKGLSELFEQGRSRRVKSELHARCVRRLEVMDQCASLLELNVPGFDFHPLRGRPQRYSIHVNGPWCITFEWKEGEAFRVDLEQYH